MSGQTGTFDVSYVAHLARMHLTGAEKAKISAQLKDILAYVAKLNELDVSQVEPTPTRGSGLSNVFRKDEVRESIDPAKVFANAPEHARDLFIVPKIVE